MSLKLSPSWKWLLILLASCSAVLRDNSGGPGINGARLQDPLVLSSGIVTMSTATTTGGSVARLQIDCTLVDGYAVKSADAGAPNANDSSWVACSGSQNFTVPLSSGLNAFNVWLKSGSRVATEATELSVLQRRSVLFEYPNETNTPAANTFTSQTRVVEAPSLGGYLVSTPEFSSDGFTANGAVHVYDTEGKFVRTLIAGTANSMKLSLSGLVRLANGNFAILSQIASIGFTNSGSVIVIDGQTGNTLGTVSGPSNNSYFGRDKIFLDNGNIVVYNSSNSNNGKSSNGIVNLISGTTGSSIAQFYGSASQLRISNGGVYKVANNRFIISSYFDGPEYEGRLTLVDGGTGAVVRTYTSDPEDMFGEFGLHLLENGNVVVPAPLGVAGTGSYALFDSELNLIARNFGIDPGYTSAGGIRGLSNGNFVVSSPNEAVGGRNNAGTVALVNGTTGAVISTLAGDHEEDHLGLGGYSAADVVRNNPTGLFRLRDSHQLSGGTIAVDLGGLVNSTQGQNKVIDSRNTAFGRGLTALTNGNYVVVSVSDDLSGVSNAGSVKLMNGSTGAVIASFYGTVENDHLGSGLVTALANGNFIFGSPHEDVGGMVNAGTLRVVNGSTGQLIETISGTAANDSVGNGDEAVFSNGSVAVGSESEAVSGVANSGRVRLINGNGDPVASFDGASSTDQLGKFAGEVSHFESAKALGPGGLALSSYTATVGAVSEVGRFMLVDQNTGDVVYENFGAATSDRISSGGIFELSGNQFVISSPSKDVDGLIDVGELELILADDLAVP